MSACTSPPKNARYLYRAAPGSAASAQRGIVLFTSLILLVILTLVGVMLTRLQTVEEQISQNDQDHQIAVQAAEATLRYAEEGLGGASESDCAEDGNGMYTWQLGTTDYFVQYSLANAPAGAMLPYAGPALPVVSTPQFLIECLPTVAIPGASLQGPGYGAPTPQVSVYRITSYSYGGDMNTVAELQEIDWR